MSMKEIDAQIAALTGHSAGTIRTAPAFAAIPLKERVNHPQVAVGDLKGHPAKRDDSKG